MKDLKHLIYFENLLQDANNELVQQAIREGQRAIGYTCFYVPEVLLNLQGCFSVALRAPGSGNSEVATYYMTNRNCSYSRCILERGLEGGYNFLSGLIGTESCLQIERMHSHFQVLDLVKNEEFFCNIMDAPMKCDQTNLDYYIVQTKKHLLNPLHERFGVDTSEKSLLAALEEHNEKCRILTEIGNFRKLASPPITGYEFHVIQLVSKTTPWYLVREKIIQTLEEIKHRKPDDASKYKARVVLAGAEIDDPEVTKLLESTGALVVADRYCFGSFPGREPIVLRPGEDALTGICRHYLEVNECPRLLDGRKIDQRSLTIKRLVDDFKADGVVFESMKFCEFWGYEKIRQTHVFESMYDIPCCNIEREYVLNNAGQLRTRFQAFVESLEIKKLNREERGTEV